MITTTTLYRCSFTRDGVTHVATVTHHPDAHQPYRVACTCGRRLSADVADRAALDMYDRHADGGFMPGDVVTFARGTAIPAAVPIAVVSGISGAHARVEGAFGMGTFTVPYAALREIDA